VSDTQRRGQWWTHIILARNVFVVSARVCKMLCMIIRWFRLKTATCRQRSVILFLGFGLAASVCLSHYFMEPPLKLRSYEKESSDGNDPTAMLKHGIVRVAGQGENIQVGELEVHVMSAIHRHDYPLPGAFNVLLVGWADRQSFKKDFYCCLATTRHAARTAQVKAELLYIDRRFRRAYMLYAFYGCSLASSSSTGRYQYVSFAKKSCDNMTVAREIFVPKDGKHKSGSTGRYQYVSFAEKSCDVNMTVAREIVVPKDGKHKVAVCIKVVYGDPDPERLVEWLEFSRLVGVDVVQMFYHSVNISRRGLDVLQYYNSTGFVSLYPLTIAVKKGHPQRWFQAAEPQAFMDASVPLNDCVHRLYRYDFVIVMDLDELLLPSPPYKTVAEVFQMAATKFPKAATFYIFTRIAVLDWPPTNNASSIFFLRYLDRTVSDKLDQRGTGRSSPKHVFRPTRVRHVSTHDSTLFFGYTKSFLSKDTHTFLHYRGCKVAWSDCDMKRVTDTAILRFESQWMQALSRLPLHRLGFSPEHVEKIRRETAASENKTVD
ncbi:hypothetical protein BaRGS_00010781, partial [Batillaria attramentaria]